MVMIKNQDNPPGDLSAGLSEIVEEIIRRMPRHGRAHIIGYAFIPPGLSVPPVAFRVIGDGDGYRLPFEMIESDNAVFITASLPPGTRIPPRVGIMQDVVRIFFNDRAATIRLRFPVDVTRSYYSIRNGILDITITKLKKS